MHGRSGLPAYYAAMIALGERRTRARQFPPVQRALARQRLLDLLLAYNRESLFRFFFDSASLLLMIQVEWLRPPPAKGQHFPAVTIAQKDDLFQRSAFDTAQKSRRDAMKNAGSATEVIVSVSPTWIVVKNVG
jgi:hypothetical protein